VDPECWFRARGVKHRCGDTDVILDLPTRLMESDHDCGRACARSVLAFHGRRGVECFQVDPLDGIDPGALERAYRSLGLPVIAGNFDLDSLRHFTRAGWPVQVAIQSGGDGHWVVVKGVSRNRVHVMDPEKDGRQFYTSGEFLDLWSDGTRHGASFVRWGLAVGRG
jgi:ABC-type bacteriocin/lantibiotic exporter with double-glycine peptidase domain